MNSEAQAALCILQQLVCVHLVHSIPEFSSKSIASGNYCPLIAAWDHMSSAILC